MPPITHRTSRLGPSFLSMGRTWHRARRAVRCLCQPRYWELRRITGASSQSLTGFSGIQILRIDVNAYEAKRAPASYRKTTPPKGRLDSNQDFRQLGAVYQTRTGVCRLAVCRPSHWTNTANLWSGVRESNPSNWFGRPAPERSANPAKAHLSCCQRTYYTVGRDGWIRTSVTLLPKQVR